MRLTNASRLPLYQCKQSLNIYGDFEILKSPPDFFDAFKEARLYEKCYKPFLLVVENKNTGNVLLVRDHFGQRPLFYGVCDNQLIVADNIPDIIKSLKTRPALLKRACDNLLSERKTYFDETIYKGICRVEPGHIYEVSKTGIINKEPFWQLDAENPSLVLKNESDYLSEFARLLKEAVQNAIGDETRVASEYSAGMDSTAIYNEAFELGFAPSLFVHEHPKGSEYEKNYNQSYEHAFLERFKPGAIHQVNADDFDAYASMRKDAERLGEPSGYLFPTFMSPLYEKVEASQARILLSGFGGDQGVSFPAHPRLLLGSFLSEGRYKTAIKHTRYMSKNPLKRILYMLTAYSKRAKYFSNMFSRVKISVTNLFRQADLKKSFIQHPYYSEFFKTHRHLLISFLQGKFSHEIRARIETSSIVAKSHGFEYRYPLLYPPLLEFFFKLPVSMLRKKNIGRYLMKLYLADYAGLPQYMDYQKHEGRAILPATVSRFKEELVNQQFNEIDEVNTKKTSKNKNILSHIDINRVVTSWMLKNANNQKTIKSWRKNNGDQKLYQSSL